MLLIDTIQSMYSKLTSHTSSLLLIPSSKPKQKSSQFTPTINKPHTAFFSHLPYQNQQRPKIITSHYSHKQEQEDDCSNGLEFIRHKKLLSELSTWGIGGPCNYFIQVTTHTQLVSAVRYCHEHSIRFLIVGKGSNSLFDDRGFNGCVILNRIEFIEKIEPGVYRVGSGYPFNRLGVQCCNEGFSGLEFAGGVPGTVGGAVYMNAGANGQETSDAIDSVEIVTIDGTHRTLDRNNISFEYRQSSFHDMEDLAAVIAVTFRLVPLPSARKRQQDFLARRRSSQPVGERSAGSVFRNPSGFSAGELIEKVGLKGFRIGGAKVSEIHANFFINSGSSTSVDMLELISLAKAKVDAKFGIQLKEEVRYIDAWNGVKSNRNDVLGNGLVRDEIEK